MTVAASTQNGFQAQLCALKTLYRTLKRSDKWNTVVRSIAWNFHGGDFQICTFLSYKSI